MRPPTDEPFETVGSTGLTPETPGYIPGPGTGLNPWRRNDSAAEQGHPGPDIDLARLTNPPEEERPEILAELDGHCPRCGWSEERPKKGSVK